MKILLVAINAKYIHSNPAVYSLKAFTNREEVEIAEYTINNRREFVLSDLYQKHPDVLAFSCYIWNWSFIRELLTDLKKLMPKVKIWMGGPEVSYDAKEIVITREEIDGIMIGEGEQTFKNLAKYYITGEGELGHIPGIIARNPNGTSLIMTQQQEIMDMNKIPFLYDTPEEFQNRIIYYESSRGCPFRCSYCLSSIDKSIRFRSLALVKSELKLFLEKKVKQVKFIDRTFNCNHEHAMEIWRFLLEWDNGVTNFHFEIAADLLTEEETSILSKMRPGLVQLEIGVQSTNSTTLQEINRVTDMNKLEQVVKEIVEWKTIHVHLDLIAGLPFEDYNSFKISFCNVYKMKPHQLQLGFLKLLKGSIMHENAEKYGMIYSSLPPYEVFSTDWIRYDEILALKKIEEMVEIYYNTSQFTTTLKILETCFETSFLLFESLANFYEKNNYFIQMPSRVARYEILLDFMKEVDPERTELYQEALTFDCYLRENMKSRPSFSKENIVTKEQMQLLKKENHILEKQIHIELFSYPVWDKVEQMKKGEARFILFDYLNRDPLTYEASIKELKINEI